MQILQDLSCTELRQKSICAVYPPQPHRLTSFVPRIPDPHLTFNHAESVLSGIRRPPLVVQGVLKTLPQTQA